MRSAYNAIISICGFVVFAGSATASSNDNSALKRQYALQYLKAIHAQQNFANVVEQLLPGMVASIRRAHPELAETALERYRNSFKVRMKVVESRLAELQLQILARHYSQDDLKGMADFYGSPAGQHFQIESRKTFSEIGPSRQKWIDEAAEASLQDTLPRQTGSPVKH